VVMIQKQIQPVDSWIKYQDNNPRHFKCFHEGEKFPNVKSR